MFGKKKKAKLHSHIDTLIGAQTQITGDICFSGGLRVDGNIKGNIVSEDGEQHTLILSNAGYIEGKIQAANVVINGTVKGPIHASRYLELQENAQIHGDVYYGSIEVKLGASVDGKMIHQDKLQSEKLVTLIPAASE
ncbi:protein CcmA, bactofilin family [Nitrosomonas sp. Nm51]|uniref:bactofilin family protein n=1 Tax=Nitrosomonas sp. Nm51 TaxID=133720 RepID=UPI0008AE7F05|nr:polymer-forming cytoskeletal protein [Nitrosomonas sp. Nm51]SER42896.1 protein CcmA, bactofilin family [Nitrosomonas sp. Nm51]